MTDRFRWLEYGDGSAPDPTPDGAARGPNRVDKDATYHLPLARTAFLSGDYEPALRHYSAAVQTDGTLLEAWSGQVRSLAEMHALEEAHTWAQQALARLPHSSGAHSAMAMVMARAGHLAEGVAESDQAFTLAQEEPTPDPFLWLDRAECFLQADQANRAQECLDRVLAAHPNDGEWLQRAALACIAAEQLVPALHLLDKALARTPQDPWLWALAGRTARRVGNLAQSRGCLERALELRPAYPVAEAERKLLEKESPLRGVVASVANLFRHGIRL